MRFENLTSTADTDLLNDEFRQAREIGKLGLGKNYLFFRDRFKVRYIPYADIRRYFRRIEEVPAKLCCGRGNFQMESLVVCCDAMDPIQIPLPDTRSAKIVMECMAGLAPEAKVGPAKA